jgi:hypothetical protein
MTEKLHLNSADDLDYESNNSSNSSARFYYKFAPVPQRCIERRISLASANFPNSLYIINNSNNTMCVNGVGVTLTNGNYNALTFITAWNALVPTIPVTFSSITKKFTWTSTEAFTFTDIAATSLFTVLGLVRGITYASVANALSSQYVVDFSGVSDVYCYSPSFQFNNLTSKDSSAKLLEVIPFDSTVSGHWYYVNRTQTKFAFETFPSDIVITLKDSNGNLLDFNNVPWRITLQIEYTYENVIDLSSFSDIFEQELEKLNNLQ